MARVLLQLVLLISLSVRAQEPSPSSPVDSAAITDSTAATTSLPSDRSARTDSASAIVYKSDSIAHTDSAAVAFAAKGPIIDLDRIVVTATRTERRMSETPASVSVVSADEIESAPARNIGDLIQNEPGVQMRRPVGMGEGVPSDVIMRGIPGALAANRSLILVDGIPTNASGAPFLILNEIPNEAIEHIEIVRGPYSSLYGANAFSGVVNVVTKKGDGRPGLEGFCETSYPFTGLYNYFKKDGYHGDTLWRKTGEMALWNTGLQSSGGDDRYDYLVSGGIRSTGNYLASDSMLVVEPFDHYMIPANNYDYRDYRFFGKGGLRITPWLHATVFARYFKSNLGYGRTTDAVDTEDISINGEKFLAGPMLTITAIDNCDITLRAYYRHIVGEFFNQGQVTRGTPPDTYPEMVPNYWDTRAGDWQVEGQAIYKAGTHQVITGGFDVLSNNITFGAMTERATGLPINNSRNVDAGIFNSGVYLQDEVSFINGRLRLVPGLRMDHHSQFGTAWSPKLGALFRPFEVLGIRGSFGRAFRAPSLTELYLKLPIKPGFDLNPNEHLKPEYLWAYEGGVDINPAKSLRLSSVYFYNSMRNLVVPNIDLYADPVLVTHGNIGSAWSQGVETDAQWKFLVGVELFASYIWQASKDIVHDSLYRLVRPDTFGVISLDYIPSHTIHFGINGEKNAGDFSITGSMTEVYVGERGYLDWMAPFNDQTLRSDSSYWHLVQKPSDQKFKVLPAYRHLDPYWRTDFAVRLTWRERLWLEVNAQNLFNAKYEESGGTYAPGLLAAVKIGGRW
jgi:outer membrane receptor protein involved in Fe transport